MDKKEKKIIAPNECSLGRWLLTLLLGFVLGVLFCIPVAFVFAFAPGLVAEGFRGIPGDIIMLTLAFAALFWGVVLALRLTAKTSLRDFVLGTGGRVNKKESLRILGLYLLGLLLMQLFSIGNLRLRGVDAGEYALLFLYMLAFIWMQTTCEELVFRGVFIRWACRNEIGFTPRAIIAGIVSTVLFMLAHAANVEVTSQSGMQLALMLLSYAIPGIMTYLADLYFKSLLPGILIHWANNFMLSTVLGAEVSSIAVQTLLVDTTELSGAMTLVSTMGCYVPVLIYMLVHHRKKKAAA